MSNQKHVRVRFAPSPTGHLHIGGLRTALFNWLFARHHGGAFLLRIEDTDFERSTREYRDSILESFAWTELVHDEDIITQSERIEEHKAVALNLVAQGKAYRCFCSQDEVVARYALAHDDNAFVRYDGYCRTRQQQDCDEGKPYVIRFKLPDNRENVVFNDLIKGAVAISLDQLDDFIIVRSGGYPMYNFVVVVDDAFMRITHVIRGEEHIINTPKQILLYQACGYEIPFFAHLPLILGPSGDKLSKRDGATSVVEYRKEGYVPHALLNYLARLGWSHGDQEIFSLSELISCFSLDTIGSKGAIFDFEKLAWLNGVYIRLMSAQELLNSIVRDVDHSFVSYFSWDISLVMTAIDMYKERVKTLKELAQEIKLVHDGTIDRNKEDMKKWIASDTVMHLDALINMLKQRDLITHDDYSCVIKELVVQRGIKLVAILQPIRLALIGKASGPGVFDLLKVIGKIETIARLSALRDIL